MKLVLIIASFCFVSGSFGQVVQVFKNKQLINTQTTVIPDGFDFTIQHRFGQIALDDSFYKDKTINSMKREERKTIVKHWGRFEINDILG